jgi:hypothetical protein
LQSVPKAALIGSELPLGRNNDLETLQFDSTR